MKRWMSLVFVAAAACGGGSDGPDGGNQMRGDYPAGPYGKTESAIIESVGFLTTENAPWALDAVWKDNSKTLMLITTSAGWCAACIDEQPKLKEWNTTFGPKGLFILEAIFEDGAFQPTTVEYAANWKRQYDVPFQVVADIDFKLGEYYDKAASPMNMIVDVTTMKIIRIISGVDVSSTEAIFNSRLN